MAAEKANFGLKTKIIGLLSFVLLMLLIVDIAWTYESQKRATEAMLLEESRVLVTEMDAVAGLHLHQSGHHQLHA